MKKIIGLLIFVLLFGYLNAQTSKEIYQEGKQLYEAKKYKEAFQKFISAAQDGNKKAEYYLGRCYDKGRGVSEDEQKAFQWYFKSSEQGYAKAQYQVGKCYKKGDGVAKDVEKAAQYFEKAAIQGNADAQYELGKCYMKGKGVALNAEKAKDYFKQAVSNPKGGDEILKELKKDAAEGDADASKILKMLKN